MNYQPSFSQTEFADKKKITRREKFLTRMESLIPWTKLLAVIEPFPHKLKIENLDLFSVSLMELHYLGESKAHKSNLF